MISELTNPLLDLDSYKFSHWQQFVPNTEGMFYYLESRGGKYGATVFFGLQYILKEYLSKGFTADNITEAATFAEAHGVPFNKEGWTRMYEKYKGKYPIKIRAVPEGMAVPTGNVLMTCESTDPEFFWLPGYLETMLMRVWYPITVATQSWYCRKIINRYLERTADNPQEEIMFKLHDFGSRGVSSKESAGIGGASHLINFMGSDTVIGVVFANHYYRHPMAAFSIPAAEHSTITSWGMDREFSAYENMLNKFAKPGKILAVVSDSYDLYRAIQQGWCKELKNKVLDSGATVVIRPDSGNPSEVVLKCLRLLEEGYGVSINSLGYKVLNKIRVIQGDGITIESLSEILETITEAGYSATNVNFGMGGGLLQLVNRDTQKFAYKVSSVKVKGYWTDVYKAPILDPSKKSKAGMMTLIKDLNDNFLTTSKFTRQADEAIEQGREVLRTVFENGEVLVDDSLETIRARAWPSR